MKKIGIVFVAVFCINSITFAQDTQVLKYFKSDDAFYLGDKRLLDSEIEMTLSTNISALEAWKKGNYYMKVNDAMKTTTWVCLGVGGGLFAISLVTYYIADAFNLGIPPDFVDYFFIASTFIIPAGLITGITIPITKSKYKSYYSDAAGIYNKSNNTVSLHIGTTGNGLGFSLKF